MSFNFPLILMSTQQLKWMDYEISKGKCKVEIYNLKNENKNIFIFSNINILVNEYYYNCYNV